jgi:hypothetical protein
LRVVQYLVQGLKKMLDFILLTNYPELCNTYQVLGIGCLHFQHPCVHQNQGVIGE